MSKINPDNFLLKIQKQKYKAGFFPILLVVISFALNMMFQIEFLKYTSLLGLALYILVAMIYKVNKAVPPISDKEIILAPMSGKILNINNNSIIIKKSLFSSVDLRCSNTDGNKLIYWKHGKFLFFTKDDFIPGNLTGMVAGNAECEVNISENFQIEIEVGNKVTAGESILAIQNNNVLN